MLVLERVLEAPAEGLGLGATPIAAAVEPRQHGRGRVVVLHRIQEVRPHSAPEREPVTVTGSVGGAVSASNITDAAPPFGSTCACERLKLRRLPTRNLLLMFRSRLRRKDPRLKSEPMTTPSFCSRPPET